MLYRFDATHDAGGLKQMVRRFRAAGVQDGAIERGDGPVVEMLVDAGLSVLAASPERTWSAACSAGANDSFDGCDVKVLVPG